MKTTTKAMVSHTNHCFRLIATFTRPPAQTPLLGCFRLAVDSTRTTDRGSTCTSVNKHLTECGTPQEWHNTGSTEPHSLTTPPLVAKRNRRSATVTGQLHGLRGRRRVGAGRRDHPGREIFGGGLGGGRPAPTEAAGGPDVAPDEGPEHR